MENSEAKAVRLVKCPKCYSVLGEPNDPVYQCGGYGTYLRGEVASDSSLSRRGRDQSANREVSASSEAPKQRESCDAQCSATSPGVSVQLPKGSKDSTSELHNETIKRNKGQSDLPDDARMHHSGEAVAQPRFSDHKVPAPKSAQAAASQSAQAVLRVLGRKAAAAAGGEVLQPHGPLWSQNFKVADKLRPRAQEPSVPWTPPAAKETKQCLPTRNHCRPVLKGAPFIICSSCYKLVQVPAYFAISTNTVRKLWCGSCFVVLSYYRNTARKKPSQDSIDQLSAQTLPNNRWMQHCPYCWRFLRNQAHLIEVISGFTAPLLGSGISD